MSKFGCVSLAQSADALDENAAIEQVRQFLQPFPLIVENGAAYRRIEFVSGLVLKISNQIDAAHARRLLELVIDGKPLITQTHQASTSDK